MHADSLSFIFRQEITIDYANASFEIGNNKSLIVVDLD